MRWSDEGRSSDLEDRRGDSGGLGLGGVGLPHIGIGGLLIIVVLSLVFHRNFLALLGGGSLTTGSTQSRPVNDAREEPQVRFVSFVLDDTQRTWTALFDQQGRQYRHAKLVLFRDVVDSACGMAQAATGPFYCPGDEKVYIDLSFYDELKQRFAAPGDFAQAYVLAHEIGHHVQKLLGIEAQAMRAMRANPSDRNHVSVRLELQADCLAGVWAHSTEQRNLLEAGDVDEALRAASAVGDDRLQRMGTGTVNPDSFTHGTSEQRAHWFKQGMRSGDFQSCNTFADAR
jgi:predicted metalloprotease